MLVGYKIDKNFQRQGYAYETLSLLIPRIFFTGEATRLEALVDATNTPSINLLKKLGFIHHSDDIAFRNIGRGNTLHHLYSLESPISVKDMHQ